VLAALASLAHAQSGKITQTNAAGWYIYQGDHPVAGRWGVHVEGQIRRNNIITEWERILLRNGLNYQVNDSTVLSAGYVYVRLSPTGSFSPSVPEQRIYEQVTISQDAGRWNLKHRARFEQVFKNSLSPGPHPVLKGYKYENRARYEISPKRPLSANYYLRFAAEPQIRFGLDFTGRTFYQLRLYSVVGRRLARHWNLESGYMFQYVVPQSGPVYQANHVLRVAVLSDAPF
jgi:hypothetical protein